MSKRKSTEGVETLGPTLNKASRTQEDLAQGDISLENLSKDYKNFLIRYHHFYSGDPTLTREQICRKHHSEQMFIDYQEYVETINRRRRMTQMDQN